MQTVPHLTFANFQTTRANRRAYERCVDFASAPQAADRILWLHGPSGVGKTHLLRAIQHETTFRTPRGNTRYIAYRNLLHELACSLQHKKLTDIYEAYLAAKVILIDDFVIRDREWEGSLHVIVDLYKAGLRVVCAETSDRDDLRRHLRKLVPLEPICVGAPQVSEMVSFLAAMPAGRIQPVDVLQTIARRGGGDVRTATGLLNRWAFGASLAG